MKLGVVGCSHHNTTVDIRERLAFNADQARAAVGQLRERYPAMEVVLLSTCNRVELYFASESPDECPDHDTLGRYLAEFHGHDPGEIMPLLFQYNHGEAIRHLFMVASSLDSMVIGEAQILSQVKQAYEMATQNGSAGPLTHGAFQAAIRVARRIARETAINQKRVSIPSVAVADFACQLFERFDDKQVLVVGAGEMGEETLRYLIDEGARKIAIVNRSPERAAELAQRVTGEARPWSELEELLIAADVVVSTTGATEPIVTYESFKPIHQGRAQRPLFILDLAVPRDFDAAISNLPGVYLYSIDDLRKTCEANKRSREKEWPKAERIIEQETNRFLGDLSHRITAPTIRQLRNQVEEIKSEELKRLFNKLGSVDERTEQEIIYAFTRLVNKLLHPPLESLRDEAKQGTHQSLLEALRRLFQIRE